MESSLIGSNSRWLPSEPLLHCLTHTGSKFVLLDSERADRIAYAIPQLRTTGVSGCVVFDAPGRVSKWEGVDLWEDAMRSCSRDPRERLREDPKIEPEDNATIIFTSGTCVLSGAHVAYQLTA